MNHKEMFSSKTNKMTSFEPWVFYRHGSNCNSKSNAKNLVAVKIVQDLNGGIQSKAFLKNSKPFKNFRTLFLLLNGSLTRKVSSFLSDRCTVQYFKEFEK